MFCLYIAYIVIIVTFWLFLFLYYYFCFFFVHIFLFWFVLVNVDMIHYNVYFFFIFALIVFRGVCNHAFHFHVSLHFLFTLSIVLCLNFVLQFSLCDCMISYLLLCLFVFFVFDVRFVHLNSYIILSHVCYGSCMSTVLSIEFHSGKQLLYYILFNFYFCSEIFPTQTVLVVFCLFFELWMCIFATLIFFIAVCFCIVLFFVFYCFYLFCAWFVIVSLVGYAPVAYVP